MQRSVSLCNADFSPDNKDFERILSIKPEQKSRHTDFFKKWVISLTSRVAKGTNV